MEKRRVFFSVALGALLGMVCIVGATLRGRGGPGNELVLLALWYNRVLIGLVIGLAGGRRAGARWWHLVRGALLGLVVSLAFYLSTGLDDPVSFAAGLVYGLIIELAVARLAPVG